MSFRRNAHRALRGDPQPHVLVAEKGAPDTIARWQALADSLLTDQACVFHRNVEISSRYAWIYKALPSCLKWAGMAAIASHHVRLALFPLRLDTDRTGHVDIPHSLGRRRLLLADVDTIRATNNAIFNDIFWVHLAYVTAEDGIQRLRTLLNRQPEYAPVLAGFEVIDRGRRVLEDVSASAQERRRADDLIWVGNVQLLEHEQRALVQPHFDHLSCAFARLVSLGAATNFEVRGRRVSSRTSRRSTSTRSPEECRTSLRELVAENHSLRRPLALDRDQRRATLPQVRRRHAPCRRQPAAHLQRRTLQRRTRLRSDPVRTTGSQDTERA